MATKNIVLHYNSKACSGVTKGCPCFKGGESNVQVHSTVEAWNHSHFLCKSNILNGLDNIIHNVYGYINTTKELWEFLEEKVQDRGC